MSHKITEMSIRFGASVEVSDEVLRMFETLADIICNKYEEENPKRVMWPSGTGSEIKWEGGDYAGCDDSKFVIECTEREDYYGSNPGNPDKERLIAEAKAQRLQAAKARTENNIDIDPTY